MTLRHMKIFVTVCQENSISQAAKKLYISQPAVSNAIKELEDYYGVILFDRMFKKLFITEVGKKVLNYALHISSLFEKMESEIKNSDVTGILKIGSSITIGTHFLPGYIKNFSTLFPDIEVFATIDSSETIEKMVLDNDLDFALIEGAVHSENIISKSFITDELVLICDTKHPLLKKKKVSISDLQGEKFLMREKKSGTRELAESILLLHNIVLKPLWVSTSTESIIQGVSMGIGISILPLHLVQDYITRKIIHKLEVDEVNFKRQYHIIHHKDKFLTQSALAFMDMCGNNIS